jgi:Flp pilus assembly protein TadG
VTLQQKRNKNTRERGQALLEVTLLAPWIFFLFVGVFDVGFYSYAAITTQNAARVAANQIANSPGAAANACQIVIPEMSRLPNVAGSSTSCASGTTASQTTPIGVCVGILTKTASAPCGGSSVQCADCALDAAATSVQVAVTYQTVPVVLIPGILPNQLTLRRFVEMRILQ